jgi:hypothetical protein
LQAAASEIERAANDKELAPARAVTADLETHLKDFKNAIDAHQIYGKA